VVAQWRREHASEDITDGHIFQPWPAGPTAKRRDQVIYYQYRADRARRTFRGIDEQVAEAEQAVAGKSPVKRNRFVQGEGIPMLGLAARCGFDLLADAVGVCHEPAGSSWYQHHLLDALVHIRTRECNACS
jgi:hypothetical protein